VKDSLENEREVVIVNLIAILTTLIEECLRLKVYRKEQRKKLENSKKKRKALLNVFIVTDRQ